MRSLGCLALALALATACSKNRDVQLTLTVNTSTGGSVTRSPANATYALGSAVTLTAVPDVGYTFTAWGGACSGTEPCIVTMSADQTVSAAFTRTTATLTVSRSGSGTGRIVSAPAGVDCGSACTASFPTGTVVKLTATANAGSVFSGWADACDGHDSCAVTVNDARTVVASFAKKTQPITVTATGAGVVASVPAGIYCGAACSYSYDQGTAVTLVAVPNSGASFLRWDGDCTSAGGAPSCVVTADGARSVTALFSASTTGGGTPAHAVITNGPANPTRLTSATFFFIGGTTYSCSLDGQPAAPCTSPAQFDALADGSHSIVIAAKDAAGTAETNPATLSWVVDTVPPITSLDSSPANPSNVTAPSFTFSSNKPGSIFACRLDAGTFARCSSPFVAPALAEGTHSFTVVATDRAGNRDSTPPFYRWVVDVTPPHTTLSLTPPNPDNNRQPSFSFSSNKPGTFRCSLDGAAAVACSGNVYQLPAALADGQHSFQVAAVDLATNVDPAPPKYTWLVDTVAPVASNVSATPAYAKAGATVSVSFTLSKSVPQDPVVKVGGQPASKTSSTGTSYVYGYTVSGNEPQGATAISILATDAAGNQGSAQASVTLDFIAPTFTVSAAPARLRMGATTTITVIASEPLQAPPTVTIAGNPPNAPPAPGRSGTKQLAPTTSFTFSYTVQASDAEGSQPIAVAGQDLAGNAGTGAGSVFFDYHVDYSRPAITLLRTPYQQKKLLSGADGAAEPGSSLRVFSDTGLTTPLGAAATASATGSFSVDLGAADLATAYLQITDVAGNVSPAIQPGAVQARLNLAGASSANVTHQAFFRSRADELAPPTAAAESATDAVAFAAADYDALAAADAARAAATRTTPHLGWHGVKPSQGRSVAMAYDPGSQKVQALIDTFPEKTNWQWDGAAWSFFTVQGSQDWNGSAMVYDGKNSRLMLWAGRSCCGGVISTSYFWNGTAWQVLAPNNSPSMRDSPGLAYDSARSVVVFVGAINSSSDTWEWNGSDWTNKTPASGLPSGMQRPPIAYDAKDGYTMLLDGATTRSWNGTAWTSLATTGPTGHPGDGLVYDANRQVVVFLDGNGNQTWEWNGTAWKQINVAGPGQRSSTAMVYDGARKLVFLHGGSGKADSWTYDGTAWTQVNAQPPPPRTLSAMAYDSVRGKSVLYGGQYATDTSEWNGTSWTTVSATNTGPATRWYHAMAYGSGVTLLQGGANSNGSLSDSYTWNGAAWTPITGSTPGLHQQHALAYDTAHSKFVLFGGANQSGALGDTWLFDPAASAWSKAATTGPSARSGAGLSFFPPRGTVVLHGGNGLNDDWEWNGTAWSPLTPLVSAFTGPSTSQGKLVYDPARHRLVLLEGSGTWEWDGAAWRNATKPPAPGRVGGCSMSFQQQPLLFCGDGSYSPFYPTGETWLYDAPRYAGEVVRFDVGSSTAPTALVASAIAGATGDNGAGAAQQGARLLVWNFARSAWAELGSNTAADADPAAARALSASPASNAADYVSGGSLYVMLLPAAPAGAVAEQLGADYVEATVTYPIP